MGREGKSFRSNTNIWLVREGEFSSDGRRHRCPRTVQRDRLDVFTRVVFFLAERGMKKRKSRVTTTIMVRIITNGRAFFHSPRRNYYFNNVLSQTLGIIPYLYTGPSWRLLYWGTENSTPHIDDVRLKWNEYIFERCWAEVIIITMTTFPTVIETIFAVTKPTNNRVRPTYAAYFVLLQAANRFCTVLCNGFNYTRSEILRNQYGGNWRLTNEIRQRTVVRVTARILYVRIQNSPHLPPPPIIRPPPKRQRMVHRRVRVIINY